MFLKPFYPYCKLVKWTCKYKLRDIYVCKNGTKARHKAYYELWHDTNMADETERGNRMQQIEGK